MRNKDASKAEYEKALKVLPIYEVELGTEDECAARVLNDISKCGYKVCGQCGFQNPLQQIKERYFLCQKCKKEVWITADTLFHGAQIFKARLIVIRLFEDGIMLNVNQAATLTGVSNDMMRTFYKTLGMCVKSQTGECSIEISSSHCIEIFSRRSRETPARKHPSAEEFDLAENEIFESEIEQTNLTADLTDSESSVLSLIESEPISFDQLLEKSNQQAKDLSVTIVSLSLSGLILQLPGDRFVKIDKPKRKDLAKPEEDRGHISIANSINQFVKDLFQGISRKNLQIYAMLHWVYKDRERWTRDSIYLS